MMAAILKALGLSRQPEPEHVRMFRAAKVRLTNELDRSDQFADMMRGMARPSRRSRATQKKKEQ